MCSSFIAKSKALQCNCVNDFLQKTKFNRYISSRVKAKPLTIRIQRSKIYRFISETPIYTSKSIDIPPWKVKNLMIEITITTYKKTDPTTSIFYKTKIEFNTKSRLGHIVGIQ